MLRRERIPAGQAGATALSSTTDIDGETLLAGASFVRRSDPASGVGGFSRRPTDGWERAALRPDLAAVSSVGDYAFGGAVHLFARSAAGWNRTDRLGDPRAVTEFGRVLDLESDALLVAAPRDSLGPDLGHVAAAYLYAPGTAGWEPIARLTPADAPAGGPTVSVALHRSTVVLAVPRGDEVALQVFGPADPP